MKQGENIGGEPLTEKARRSGVEDPAKDCHTLMGTSSLWGINLTYRLPDNDFGLRYRSSIYELIRLPRSALTKSLSGSL